MTTATVTIPYDEFQEIKEAKKTAEEKASKLIEEVKQAKIESSDPHLFALAQAALDVVRYAVASLPAESNIGWPFESLKIVAYEVLNMPNATPDHIELSMTLSSFAKECEEHERRRMHRMEVKQRTIVAPATPDP